MFEKLKEEVCKANLELYNRGVVIYTWGNVSGITEDRKYIVIKPSGLSYEKMTPDDMVVMELETGNVIDRKWNPSSDTQTHLVLYKRYKTIKGIAHIHSVNAVAFAQAGRSIPILGTTHADYFCGDIPCTRDMKKAEVEHDYELNTGKIIAETIDSLGIEVNDVPGVLVKNHGPFTWGGGGRRSGT